MRVVEIRGESPHSTKVPYPYKYSTEHSARATLSMPKPIWRGDQEQMAHVAYSIIRRSPTTV
jgi:hypothetical protein